VWKDRWCLGAGGVDRHPVCVLRHKVLFGLHYAHCSCTAGLGVLHASLPTRTIEVMSADIAA
jgi:hypothetical protein